MNRGWIGIEMGQAAHGRFFRADGLAICEILPREQPPHIGARLDAAAWQGKGSPLVARALVLAAGVTVTTLTTVAQADDRPVPQPAPVAYARICDASGNGYFSIPGSGRCLQLGNLAPAMLGDQRVFDSLARRQPLFRDNISDGAPRETLARLTSGRARLTIDPDGQNLGPGAILAELAYTATFGDGFSPSLSFADPKAELGGRIVTPPDSPSGIDGSLRGSSRSKPSRISEIVGNLRLDPYWGEAKVPASADPHAALAPIAPFPSPKGLAPPYALPALTGGSNEFAAQGGGQSSLDYLSPGDKLWLQAAYEKAPPSYAADNAQASLSQNYVAGWSPQINFTCAFADRSKCDQQSSWDITGAYKNYWLPILNSTPFGSTLEVRNRIEAPGGSASAAGNTSVTGALIEPGLFRSPLTGFDIGAEYMYARVSGTRPAGAAIGNAAARGLPAFSPSTGVYDGRLRVQRGY